MGGLPHVLVETTGGQQTISAYGNGLAWQVNADGTHRYYHQDSFGSTRVVTDDAGTAVSAYPSDGARLRIGKTAGGTFAASPAKRTQDSALRTGS